MSRKSLVSHLMNEVTNYGGLPMRRCDVLRLATEHMGEHARPPFGAEYFAFAGPTVNANPWTLEAAREVMSS